MIYLIIPVVSVIVGSMIYVKISADLEVEKEMEVKNFWQRMNYADEVINQCLQIESE